MKIIREPLKLQRSFLGEQQFDPCKKYRKITYITQLDTDNGLLIYNNLTDELLFLETDEATDFESINIKSAVVLDLVKKWFLVPEQNDDVTLCDKVTNFVKILTDSYSSTTPITKFTILTTTECNARCFYCYELGRKKITMSEQTASDVADFIIKSCKGEMVTFRWFGGEPLCNSKAIDIICSKLRESGTPYKSNMISNGYLFDDEIIKRAQNLWNLKNVQITLDGTEEVYNKCKAFIYKEGSAFKRVIANIRKLLEKGISVKIRMNADIHNIDNLYCLVDFLKENFGSFSNITLYSQLIFENTGNNKNRSDDEKAAILNMHSDFRRYIVSSGMYNVQNLDDYLRPNQCMADSASATVIAPDGNLGRCEHFSESEFYGSIYSKTRDNAIIDKFKELRPFTQMCADCPVRPACHHLIICPDAPDLCNTFYKNQHINGVKSRILQTYKEYKTKHLI